MFQRASPLALCHQTPRRAMNEPLPTVTADFGRFWRGDWWQSPFEQGELTPLAER